ncbi:CRTAC1 family protein [Sphingorhabdus lutea]|nr:CRTAC1 family protein [Sphingorhabdus lutea]
MANSPSTGSKIKIDTIQEKPIFEESKNIIAFENRNRRKWDNAVIADIDQDGLQDIIITEHGQRIRLFWNEGGKYSEPVTIANGDLHGVTAADFDKDGRMDIIIAQGGGDGNNPRRPLWYQVNQNREITGGDTLSYFEPGRGRATKFLDSDGDGTLDLIVTGFPLPSQKDGANHLYANSGEGDFTFIETLPQAKWLGYRTLITDFNGDNDADILFFGGDDIAAVQGGAGDEFNIAPTKVFGDLLNISNASSISEIDFDNDGDFDLFITRAENQFIQETYYDEATQRFAFFTFRQDYLFEDLSIDGDLIVENLQVNFPHFDVFVGAEKRKLKFQSDRHGGKDFTLKAEDAMGWPEGPTKAGLYIGYVGEGKWRIGGEVQSRTAAVINNVTSRPKTSILKSLPAILLENQNGQFVDATEKLDIKINEQTTSAAVGDFNNDGWSDIAILKYGNMAVQNEHIILFNQRGRKFAKADISGIRADGVGMTGGSIETIDYDQNGALDLLYSNERGKWHLLSNNIAEKAMGHFVIVNVGFSSKSNASALHAILNIKACGQNFWRKVGASSASFSQNFNTQLHVGLGKCTSIDAASLRWSDGEEVMIKMGKVDQKYQAGLVRK